MIRVCPIPDVWDRIYHALLAFRQSRACDTEAVPRPLILSGWHMSNDAEKIARWAATVRWAEDSCCAHLIPDLNDDDYYCVREVSTYEVGPFGGPVYQSWNFVSRNQPSKLVALQAQAIIRSEWSNIVGLVLGNETVPLGLTGPKLRCLQVYVFPRAVAPWGGWGLLSKDLSKRRLFTAFRAAINAAIAPHSVDHIKFTPDHMTRLSG